jgi:hypothetical protein
VPFHVGLTSTRQQAKASTVSSLSISFSNVLLFMNAQISTVYLVGNCSKCCKFFVLPAPCNAPSPPRMFGDCPLTPGFGTSGFCFGLENLPILPRVYPHSSNDSNIRHPSPLLNGFFAQYPLCPAPCHPPPCHIPATQIQQIARQQLPILKHHRSVYNPTSPETIESLNPPPNTPYLTQ